MPAGRTGADRLEAHLRHVHPLHVAAVCTVAFAPVVCARQSALQGVVRAADGKAVDAAWVEARCGDVAVQTSSARDGAFTFDHLPLGECWIVARSGAEQSRPRKVRVSDGISPGVVIRLEPSSSMAGELALTTSAPTIGHGLFERMKQAGFTVGGSGSARDWRTVPGDRRETWRANASISFTTPTGFRVTAGVHGRQGVSVPLALEQDLAGGPLFQERLSSGLATQWNGTVWDTQFRVERYLKRTGLVRVRAVGEVLNLFDLNRASSGSVTSGLAPRTFRGGIVIDFGR